MSILSYSYNNLVNVKPKGIFGFLIRFFTMAIFFIISIRVSKEEWFETRIGQSIFLITVITSLFLTFYLVHFTIGLLDIISYFHQNKSKKYTKELPDNISIKESDFYYVKDTIVISKSSEILTIKYDNIITLYSISGGILLSIWIFMIFGILLYVGIFIGVFEVNLNFFSLDILIIIELIWLFNEFIYPGNNLVNPLIKGIRFFKENIVVKINFINNSVKITSRAINLIVPSGELILDLSDIRNVDIKPIRKGPSDEVVLTLPNKYIKTDNTHSYLIKEDTNDIVILIIPNQILANQIISLFKSINL